MVTLSQLLTDELHVIKLTSIKNLLGRQGSRFLLFGMLTRNPQGHFCLEDPDDSVVLNLKHAVRSCPIDAQRPCPSGSLPARLDQNPAVGLFTEGAFVMVDGVYEQDASFTVSEIAHPPSEGRTVARSVDLQPRLRQRP